MKYFLSLGILLVFCCLAFRTPETRHITGTVVDESGALLAGVTIKVKSTGGSTLSDSKGAFSVAVEDQHEILVFSFIGYETQEVSTSKQTNLHVVLHPVKQTMQEVVIVGYGVRANRRTGVSTGAYPAMSYTASNANVLQGRAAGIRVSGGRQQPEGYNSDFNTESYDHFTDNPFQKVKDEPRSTFSIDVDAASYSNIRRMINQGQLPPPGAVRIEEMINYFSYSYPQPSGDKPFSVNTELADCPWNTQHKLLLIGLQGKKIPYENLPPSNLVFLIDVSGSMMEPNKLPLVQSSLKLLVDQLRPHDKVAIVVYAGNAGLVLPSTEGNEKEKIKDAINALETGGSTAGGAGIKLAYKVARENFMKNGNNRIILCTDGDFNVGASSDDELVRLIEKEKESGVYLTVLGYGMGNYKDSKMQQLADKGNGNHAYIDGLGEAKKVLIHEFGGTLFTIAKDVKLQLEFNPTAIQGYRLIGYENRMLAKEDFNNDKKDAGELGSGHTVTALYELIPQGVAASELDSVDALRYQQTKPKRVTTAFSGELLNIKLRYKQPDGDKSQLLENPVSGRSLAFGNASANMRFAAAVASFGMQLRGSKYKGDITYNSIIGMAQSAVGEDKENYRNEFVKLVELAHDLAGKEEGKTAKE